jgi:hypothetical protein
MNTFYPTTERITLDNGEVMESRDYRDEREPEGGLTWEQYTGRNNEYRQAPWTINGDKETETLKVIISGSGGATSVAASTVRVSAGDIQTGTGKTGDHLQIAADGVKWDTIPLSSLKQTSAMSYQPLCWDGEKYAPMYLKLV